MPGGRDKRYHEVVGLQYDETCKCGCKTKIEAGPQVRVVVDMEAHPKLRYIPGHDPETRAREIGREMYPSGTNPPPPQKPEPPRSEPPKEEAPCPQPRAPEPESAPRPNGGGQSFAFYHVTLNLGNFESIKVGLGDYSQEGESFLQLRNRVTSRVTEDVRFLAAETRKIGKEVRP